MTIVVYAKHEQQCGLHQGVLLMSTFQHSDVACLGSIFIGVRELPALRNFLFVC
jgi:hypothetical protein